MSLKFKCPSCGGYTVSHSEYSNGFRRYIYDCVNCNWTNRYTQTIIGRDISTIKNIITVSNNKAVSKGGL